MKHKITRLTALMLAVIMTFSVLLVPVEAASFRDVSDGAWYAAAVDYVHGKGWMAGVSETSFAPNTEVTRGMFVTVLARYAEAETDNETAAFADTTAGRWYTGAAAWAVEQGIVSGVGGNCFAPTRNITRQELCAILYKFIQKQELKISADADLTFSDFESVSSYAREAVGFCAAAGLISGFEDGSFRPAATATRAQLAQILMRLDLLVKGEEAPTDPMPAQSFDGEADNGMAVSVEAPEGALPENTELTLNPVNNALSLNYLASKLNGKVLAASDISFAKDGSEIKPAAEVEVEISVAGLENAKNPAVVHLKDDGSLEYVNARLVSTNRAGTEKAMRFSSKDFSVYAVVDSDTNNDSSRLVVKIWKRNAANDGYEIDKQVMVTRQDVDRLATIIPDGETPTVYGKELFCGWYLDTEAFNGGINEPRYTTADVDGQHTMDAAREGIKDLLNDSSFVIADSSTAVNIYPIIFNYFVITLVDENGETTYDTTVKFTKENSVTYTPQYVYSPLAAGYRFLGWQKDDGDETVYANGEEAQVTQQTTVFRAQVQKGYWLSFNENPDGNHSGATYNGPEFCVDGIVTSAVKPKTDPTLPGYIFGGWYTDTNYTTAFNFNQTISADTTVYAKWTAKTKVGYTIIVWRQSVDDLKTYTDAQKTYDYAFSYVVPDSDGVLPNTDVSSLDLSAYKNKDGQTITVNGTDYSFAHFKYSKTQTAKTGSGNVTIGDGVVANSTTVNIAGNTVINLYYDRELVTFNFYVPSGSYSVADSPNWSGGYSGYYYANCCGGYYPISTHGSSYNYALVPYSASVSYRSSYTFYTTLPGDNTFRQLTWHSSYSTWYTTVNNTNYWYDEGDFSDIYCTVSVSSNVYVPVYQKDSSRTMTGLYQQRLVDNGYTWDVSTYRWYTSTEITATFDSIVEMFDGSQDYYGRVETLDATVKHYMQNTADDDWPTSTPYTVYAGVGNWMAFKRFQGFSQNSYRVKLPSGVTSYKTASAYDSDGTISEGTDHTTTTGWTDWLEPNTALYYSGMSANNVGTQYTAATTGGIEYRYSRNKYRIQYMVGGYYNDKGERITGPVSGLLKRTGAIYYEKNISSYADYYTDPAADLGTDEFVFDDWYTDPTCTIPYSFSGKKMPLDGLTLYAKFVQKEYRVFIHANIPEGLGSNAYWPNGVKTNMKVDYMDMVEGGEEIVIRDSRSEPQYELVGWYTDSDCKKLYNFGTKLTDKTTVDYDWDNVTTDTGPYTSTYDGTVIASGVDFNKDKVENRFWVTGKLDLYAKWRRRFPGANGIHVDYNAVENAEETGRFNEYDPERVENWTDPLAYTDDAYVIARSASTPDAPEDYQFLYWEILDKDGNPYTVTVDGETTLDPAKLIYPGQGFHVNGNDAVEETITNPVTTHQHTLVHYEANPATCLDGNYEYWYCTSCGKYYWNEACTIEATYGYQESENDGKVLLQGTGNHDYSDWASNQDGTHSKTCANCGNRVTEACTFTDVVTAPTTTSQGYTTHTCTVCGYSYVDTYVDPIQVTHTVTATVSGGHGAVSPDSATVVETEGTSFTAEPEEGYMISSVSVEPSSAATAEFENNTVTVSNVTADCTVTVTFVASVTYTVTYMANGRVLDTETVVKNHTVILPDSATTPTGCTFLGWVEDVLVATTEEQTDVIQAGEESEPINGDKTFYALYSFGRTEPVAAYELLTAAPADWAGKYVVTYLSTTGLYALKGLTGDTSYESASVGGTVTYANSGMTRYEADGKVYLLDVANDYVFTAASVTGGYSLQNAATNGYLCSYSSTLYNDTDFETDYCVWSLAYDGDNNCMVVSNSASSSYPYLVKGSNSYFVVNSTYTAKPTQFWKETTVDYTETYYTTSADANYTVTAQVNDSTLGSVTPDSATVAGGGSVTFTATPAEGVTYAEPAYTVTGGSANVTRNGNVFTVTPSGDCTLTVNFAPKTYTVAAQVDTASHGTVSVSGSPVTHGGSATVTFTPAEGYTLADPAYTLSGSATVTQDGNSFTVTPTEDCTLTLNTVALYTVTYMVNGAVNSTASVAAGGSVTLPTASIDGYTFLGWSETSYGPTTTEPEASSLLSGSYTPSRSVTLYAAFTYSEGGTETTGYTNYSNSFTDWSGKYVITYGSNFNSMYVLKGLSGNTSYESSSAGGSVLFTSTGITYDTDTMYTLYNVDPAYVWTVAYTEGKYTLQNESTGTYLGSYSNYLYSRSSYSSDYCLWSLSRVTEGSAPVKAENSASSRYPYLSYGSYFIISDTAPSNLLFWLQETVNVGGTIYYATELGGSAACTVTYRANGTTYSTETVNSGASVTLPTGLPAVNGWTFAGWSSTEVSETSTQPTVLTGSQQISGNTTFYAVYSKSVSGDAVYERVTSTSSLAVNDKIIIAANATDPNYSLSTTQNANNRKAVAGTQSGTNYTPADTTAILTLGSGTTSGTWSFYDPENSGYLYAASSSNNYLRTEGTLSANSSFTISFDDSANATIIAQGTNTRNHLRYNADSWLFGCYTSSSTMKLLFLYKQVSGSSSSAWTTSPGSGSAAVTEPAQQLVKAKAMEPASAPAADRGTASASGADQVRTTDKPLAVGHDANRNAVEVLAVEPEQTPVSVTWDANYLADPQTPSPVAADSVTPATPVTATTDKYEIVTSFEDGGVYIIGYTNTDNNYVYVVTTNEYSSSYGMILPTRVTRTLGSDGYYTFSSDIASYQWTAANTSGSYYSLYNSATEAYLGSYYYNYSTLYVALMDGGMSWSYDSTNRYLYNYRTSTPTGNKYLYWENSGTSYGTYGYLTFVTSASSADPFTLYKKVTQTAPTTYTVTADPGDHGSISSANPVTVEANGTATFTVQPDDGYEIESVSLNNSSGTASFSGNTVTVSNVTGDCTVTVTYKVAGSYYAWVPTDIIEPGEDYLIGFIVDGTVYLAVNYNATLSSNNYYYSSGDNYYGYTAPATMDTNNPTYVVGVTGNATEMQYCVWNFSTETGGIISSGSQSAYYLQSANRTSYVDLHPGTTSMDNWVWNAQNHTLSRESTSAGVRYAQYYTTGGGNYMCVTTNGTLPTNGTVQLYSRQLITPVETHLVTFKDGYTGETIDIVEVEDGQDATAPTPPDHSAEFYFFTDWNKTFTNVTEDMEVTALYVYRRAGYYTVTFRDWNGAILQVNGRDTQEVKEGMNAIAPAIPSRQNYVFKTWDKDLRNVTQNMTVYAQYASLVTKTYTVNLKAVYGPVTPLEKTHVNWYANNDTEDCMPSELVTINENIEIQNQTTYLETDGGKLENPGYTFLGWARLPEYTRMDEDGRDYEIDDSVAEDPVLGYRITQYNDLTDRDLWLVYNAPDKEHENPYFTVRENNQLLSGGAEFKHIAANENDPYHGLYAIWKRDVFYVMHSHNGDLEAVGMPVDTTGQGSLIDGLSYKVGTFDLTSLVHEGHLYGGYYGIYGGADDTAVTRASQSFTFTGRRGWTASSVNGVEAVHSVDNWINSLSFTFTGYTGSYLYVDAEGNTSNTPQFETDADGKIVLENGKPKMLTQQFWTAANALTVDGRSMTPQPNEVYYLKEVPDAYLRSKIIYVNDNPNGGNIIRNYLLSYVDDKLYSTVGFKYVENSSLKLAEAASITPSTYLTNSFKLSWKEEVDGSKVERYEIVDNTVFGLDRGLVSVLDVNALIGAGNMITMLPVWTTYDGVTVEHDPMLVEFNEDNTYIYTARDFPGILYVDLSKARDASGQEGFDWIYGGDHSESVPMVRFFNDAEGLDEWVTLEQIGDTSIYMAEAPNAAIDKIIIARINPEYADVEITPENEWSNERVWTQTGDISYSGWSLTSDLLDRFQVYSTDSHWSVYTP